jgi:hypothetical protein
MDVHVVVVGPMPMFQFKSAHACRTIAGSSASCDVTRATLVVNIRAVLDLLGRTAGPSANIHVFNAFELLCPDQAPRCTPLRDGMPIFRDRDHLNAPGAASLAPAFERFLVERRLVQLQR